MNVNCANPIVLPCLSRTGRLLGGDNAKRCQAANSETMRSKRGLVAVEARYLSHVGERAT